MDIDLSTVKMKYYFADEAGLFPSADIYYSSIAVDCEKTGVVNIDLLSRNVLYSFEISFSQGAGILKPGNKVTIMFGVDCLSLGYTV